MYSDGDPHIQHPPQPPVGDEVGVLRSSHWQAAERDDLPDQLHVCFHCRGDRVYPLDWCEEGVRHWRIFLRCPDCESRREGVFEQATVERLEDELDRATAALLGDLRRVTNANMTEEIDFFIRALDADVIVPTDFCRAYQR